MTLSPLQFSVFKDRVSSQTFKWFFTIMTRLENHRFFKKFWFQEYCTWRFVKLPPRLRFTVLVVQIINVAIRTSSNCHIVISCTLYFQTCLSTPFLPSRGSLFMGLRFYYSANNYKNLLVSITTTRYALRLRGGGGGGRPPEMEGSCEYTK